MGNVRNLLIKGVEYMLTTGHDKLWNWFGLSYDSFIILPRSLCHAMPDEWQMKMAELMEEWDDTWDWGDCEFDKAYVQVRKDGKFVKMPEIFTNYRHPKSQDIENMRNKA
jgi:hypothetical protein